MKTTILVACMSAALMTSVAIARETATTDLTPTSTPTSTPASPATSYGTSNANPYATPDATATLSETHDQTMMGAGSESEAMAVLRAVNDHEVKAAEMALDKNVSTPVAEYAQMLHDEHTGNQEKTRALADSAEISMQDTPAVDALKARSEAQREQLSTMEGVVFERAFIAAMVQDHIEVLAKIDDELLPMANDTEFADHLRTTRTHIAKHLEHARKLGGSLQASR